MSDTTAAPIVGADIPKATEHASDDVNAHTPDPPAVPVPKHVPDDPAPEGLTELRALVGTLASSVDTLTRTVADLATKNAPKDVSPAQVPWTHRSPLGSSHPHVTDQD